MRIMLFGGGLAGQLAASALASRGAEHLAGVVWDEATGEPPQFSGVPFFHENDCQGVADTLFCSGYGGILKEELLQAFPRGCYNAHPSLLPGYRGRHAIQWAIASGETELGVTVHTMIPAIDQGEVVLVRRRHFGPKANLAQISRELAAMAADMLVELCDRLQGGEISAPLPSASTVGPYWRRRRPEDGQISWQDSTAHIVNLVRAGSPDYPAFAYLADGTRVSFTGYLAGDTPGEVLWASPSGCLIAAADGLVWLTCDTPLKPGDILK
jgi:methionyl-tRNA formyltransferase